MAAMTQGGGWASIPAVGWFGQQARGAGAAKDDPVAEDGSREWLPFEFADSMEQGLAIGSLTAGFLLPAPPPVATKKLIVLRSKDRNEHVLQSERGEPLLVAKGTARNSKRIDFYIPAGGDPPTAVGPAFVLEARDMIRETWELTTEEPQSAVRGRGKPRRKRLAYIRHRRELIGESSAMCMKVDLPTAVELNDGVPGSWAVQGEASLESKRPKWSVRLGCLALDFRNRCDRASSKNFQLKFQDAPDDKAREPELLYGKNGEDAFSLDYRQPLSMVQAFAIAMSTCGWR